MRLHFDYNEVPSEIIKEAVDYFYEKYQSDDLQFGAVSVYITVRSKEDNANIGWYRQDGKESELYIKSKPLKKTTNKKLIATINGEEEDESTGEKPVLAYIYLK